jgi:group I intron endonuclease
LYVGYSNDIEFRFYHHKRDLNNNKHWNTHLQKAWNKYSELDFEFLVLEQWDNLELLPSMENYWCNLLNTHNKKYGYNKRLTHPDGNKLLHSKETYQKVAKARTKQIYVFDLNGNFLQAYKSAKDAGSALKLSSYTRIRMCCAKKAYSSGKYRFSYTKKLSDIFDKKFSSSKKKVYQYTKEDVFIKEWNSTREVANFYKTSDTNIQSVCKNKTKTAKGFKWSYIKYFKGKIHL